MTLIRDQERTRHRASSACRTRLSPPRRSSRPKVIQATVFIVLLGLLWRAVRYALGFPLWGDEAFVAVTLLEGDFAGLSRPLEFFQIVPPGFLWSEWLMVHCLGSGEWALRLIPFLAGVASLLLFWRFCRGVASRRTTLMALAILAASFYPVRHAAEVKPYATDLLVSLILTTMGWAVYRRMDSFPRWWAMIAAAGVGVWCSYPAVFPAGRGDLVGSCRLSQAFGPDDRPVGGVLRAAGHELGDHVHALRGTAGACSVLPR